MQLTFIPAAQLKPKPDESKLGFWINFTDHMFNMDYTPDKGWHKPRIEPYASLEMDPASMVLHYGQAVFEFVLFQSRRREVLGAPFLVPARVSHPAGLQRQVMHVLVQYHLDAG